MSPSPWRVLFDGKSLTQWRGYKTDAVPTGWRVENGTLAKSAPVLAVKDEAGFFSSEAIEKANAAIRDIRRRYQRGWYGS